MRSVVWLVFLFVSVAHGKSSCEEVPFVSRAEWGARPPTSITNLTGKPFYFYVIHHTYQPPNCYDDATCIERVQAIQKFHQDDRGWADIGYHFLVGENGKVYEGRGWDRQGAHAPGWNNDAFGICIIGDFRTASPNQKALDAVKLWIDCGIERGHVRNDHYIITHRQSQRPGYTECPGDGTINAIKSWPRYCSYQNSGANLTQGETQVSVGREFCERQVPTTTTSGSTGLVTYLVNIFIIALIGVHYSIE